MTGESMLPRIGACFKAGIGDIQGLSSSDCEPGESDCFLKGQSDSERCSAFCCSVKGSMPFSTPPSLSTCWSSALMNFSSRSYLLRALLVTLRGKPMLPFMIPLLLLPSSFTVACRRRSGVLFRSFGSVRMMSGCSSSELSPTRIFSAECEIRKIGPKSDPRDENRLTR